MAFGGRVLWTHPDEGTVGRVLEAAPAPAGGGRIGSGWPPYWAIKSHYFTLS